MVFGENVKTIGASAFSGCTGLTEIVILGNVATIGSSVFSGCENLSKVELNCKTLGDWLSGFPYVKYLTLGDNVTVISGTPFVGCQKLESIVVSSGNPVYNSGENSNSIIETSTKTLVAGCKNTIITSSVTNIGERAFRGCSGLTSIEIPNSVTSIGERAFSNCSGLTSVTIPKSVISIGINAFSGCI